MKQFFKTVLATVVGFVLSVIILVLIFIGIISAIIASSTAEKTTEVGDKTVLHIKMDKEVVERSSNNPFENFNFSSFEADQPLGLNEVLENIHKAKTDDKISGIFLDLSTIEARIATIEEIRNALLDFKTSKKFIYAYSEYYSQASYYLATVADKIYMHPIGVMEWKGLSSKTVFLKGLFDKLEIEPQIIRHGQFKSAIEPLILDKMSEANRLQTMAFVQSVWNHAVSEVSTARNIPVATLNAIADSLMIEEAEDAVKYKMIDGLKYRDEMMAILKEINGDKAEDETNLLSLNKYSDAPDPLKVKLSRSKIAVIYANGSISSGEGGKETIGSETIAKAIKEAREDSSIKAIVLRVNSPGGSALASDVIWRETVLAKQAKPLVVSMGDLAASGGYYIACAADTIVASPNTLTGSIGVFGVIPNFQKFFNNKLGITFDGVKTNQYSDLGSTTRPLSSVEKAYIQKSVEKIYDDFVSKVSEGRKMSKADVDSIGQGRVWTGEDALKLGLVDKLGGIGTAIKIAARMAKLNNYRILELPKQKEPLQEILDEMSGDAEAAILKSRLGDSYEYYKQYETIMKLSGIEAILPFDIIVE